MSSYQNLSGGRNATLSGQRPTFDLISVIQLVGIWRLRVRTRRQLAQLDDRQLSDIGVSRIDIEREIIKPFWSE